MSATRLSPAARGGLARLFAVIAVLAGVVVAHGIQCSAATATMAAPMASIASVATQAESAMSTGAPTAAHHRATPATTETVDQRTAPMTVRSPTAGSPATKDRARLSAPRVIHLSQQPPDAPWGLLATCLTLIIAVAAAGVALRHIRPPILAVVARPVRTPTIRSLAPRAPRLAELCLLRT